MKNLRNISYAVAAFLVTSATSCKKFLDESNPHSTVAENALSTPAGFVGLVNSAYQDLHTLYGVQDGTFMLETGTDIWYSAGRAGYAKGVVTYEGLNPGQNEVKSIWTACYRGINLCNAGILRIDEAGFKTDAEKNTRLAELRFLRALYYYHVVEQWGGVVLNTKDFADGININPVRSKPEEFYDLIIEDLQFAKANLPVSWPASDYSRASKKSAMGLLARALLTRAYYSTGADAQAWFGKAKDAALEVINTQGALGVSLFATLPEIGQSVYGNAATRAKNKESLFSLSYDETNTTLNYNTKDGNRIFKYFLTKYTSRGGMLSAFVPAYGSDGESRIMPTWHLLDLYDEKIDARYNAWFQEVWIANTNYTWKIGDTSTASTYGKKLEAVGKVNKIGDTALWCTKGVVPFDKDTCRYLASGSNQLFINPIHGQGANIVDNKTTTNYYPSFKKFVNQARTFTGTTDYGDALIIRLTEMYMIAAEAYVQLGDKASAATYMNFIRKRAAVPGQESQMLVTAANMDMNFILDERAREFAGELQRWYDLKRVFRTGQDWVAYITKWNPDMTSILPYFRNRPVPTAELNALANAKEFDQNEGYPKP